MTTRRNFLTQVSRAGGFGATYMIMQSLGLLPAPATQASVLQLPESLGKGKTVVILGAGISGMASAWELSKAGYTCVILEARARAGGRNWTVRNGTRIDMTDGTSQTCSFEEGNYFNAGPARLPSQHQTMLNYCHEFGVPLEVEVNASRSSLLQSDKVNGGKPVQQRRVISDTRGHISELLAKAIRRNALDQEISAADNERMLEFLRTYGDLSPDYFYKGSEHAGYKTMPGAGDQPGELNDPLDMRALLDGNFWDDILYEEQFPWQATMFQPVGGMDRIPAAFEKRVGHMIRFQSPVRQIRKTPGGVRVIYRDVKTGTDHTIEAHYCICALPFTILKDLDTDFSPDLKAVIKSANYDGAYKIAWESRRFWEKEFQIYGGISFLDKQVNLVWYPSARIFSEKGVVIAGYGLETGTDFEPLNLAAKIESSRRSVEYLHPGYSKELGKPMCICWGRIPYNLGSWIHLEEPAMYPGYERAIQMDDPIFLAGDHMSHIVGWQEGAALSAHRAVSLLTKSQAAKQSARAS
jgi:monoamine oxidase